MAWIAVILQWIFFGLVALLALGCVQITSARKSHYHSFSSMFKQYVTQKLLHLVSKYMRRRFDNDTKKFIKCQEEILLKRLRSAQDTAYGRDHQFSEISSLSQFRRVHPVTDYGHYAGYVQRLAAGEKNVLFSEPLRSLACTSGTSGGSKLMPMNRGVVMDVVSGVLVLWERQTAAFPGHGRLQRQMRPFVAPRWRYTEAGVPIGPASVAPPGERDGREHTQYLYNAPPEASHIASEPDAIYVHLLFNLRDRELGAIEANFASFVYTVFQSLEREWRRLVRDIARGKLGEDVDVTPEVRAACDVALSPDPQRAAELEAEFQTGFTNVARRVWPHLNYITTVTSGSMSLYADRLRRDYTGYVPLYSALYGATEGILGLNLWPELDTPRYVLCPRSMVFEFELVGQDPATSGDLLLGDQVSPGQLYELVVSTRAGFYRFRLGDVVRVVDFYNTTPVVEFMYRRGQLLDVHSEKMSETAFYGALRRAADGWPGHLVDYTTAESVLSPTDGAAGTPPHYLVFVETDGPALTPSQAEQLDACLCSEHEVYRSFRVKGSIGAARVLHVRAGTFQRLRQHVLRTTNATPLQFKVPRVLKSEALVQLMLENVRNEPDIQ